MREETSKIFGSPALPEYAFCFVKSVLLPAAPPLQIQGSLWESRRSANFARYFAHTNLLTFKIFRAVITSQDLSFDTKFGRLKSRDTVPLRVPNLDVHDFI